MYKMKLLTISNIINKQILLCEQLQKALEHIQKDLCENIALLNYKTNYNRSTHFIIIFTKYLNNELKNYV